MKTSPLIRIVDDDEALIDAIRYVVEGEGYLTAAYPSAEAFLQCDDPRAPGCLLLDVRMGGMSGPQLFEELRHTGHTIPIIFLSAHGSIDLAVDLMQKGAVSFLPKPVGSERLLRRSSAHSPMHPSTAPLPHPTRSVHGKRKWSNWLPRVSPTARLPSGSASRNARLNSSARMPCASSAFTVRMNSKQP